jgi:hypothetical protein
VTATSPHPLHPAQQDPWHELLTTRYVCEICLTRYFSPRRRCAACNRFGHVRPLVSLLMTIAHDDEDLRQMIARGQMIEAEDQRTGYQI